MLNYFVSFGVREIASLHEKTLAMYEIDTFANLG